MRVFVAGATGVVGRRVVPLLIRGGHDVSAIARSPEGAEMLGRAGARAVRASLFDRGMLERAVAGHDAVVNLATHMPPSSTRMLLPFAWRENDRIRRDGAANLAEAAVAAGARRFIQESFAPAYPDRGASWIDEDTPLAPARYNRTLADAERAAGRFSWHCREGIVLRFAAFYGPDAFHVHEMARLVRRGWAPLPGAADAYISSVSHDDAASAVIAALHAPPGIYNVVDDEPLTRREYFDSLADALGVPHPRLPPQWIAGLMGSAGKLLERSERISNRKLRAATGWAPVFPSAREGWRALFGAAPRRPSPSAPATPSRA